MTYLQNDNDQNLTGNNSYRLINRLNSALLEQNYQPHQLEEFQASAIDPELVRLNIANLDGDRAVGALLWGLEPAARNNPGGAREKYTRPLQHVRQGGLAFYGVDPLTGERTECLSFKPDRPRSPDRKYENPRQVKPQAIYPAVTYRIWQMVSDRFNVPLPPDVTLDDPALEAKGFWLWVIEHNLPTIITEGAKKALSAMSQGFPALGLTGLWNWTDSIKDENGKTKSHRLIETLHPIATPERVINIALEACASSNDDRDKKASTNRAVIQSRSALAKCLIERECQPFSIPWDVEYKGIDDLIAECGIEALELAIANRERLTGEQPNFKHKPAPNIIAEKIAKELTGKVLYDAAGKMWRVYTAGVWLEKGYEEIELYFYERICLDVPELIPSYVENVMRIAKWKLLKPKWDEVSGVAYIPFDNGVWDVANRKLLPHSPDFLLTWKLPREYPSVIGLEYNQIDNFLTQVTKGNQQLKNILIAAANAVLLGRCDLQKAIYLVGSGGNGKGSFLRLLEMLVGDPNTHSSTLHDICENNFELANIYKKRLIICPDEDKRIGGLSRFKSITGGDSIRGEKKGKDAFKFRFEGMVAIASNDPIFLGDSSYGLSRRLITIPFKYQVPTHERRDLEAEFTADLPAFTSYLLSLDRDWVKSTLMGSSQVAQIRETEWDLTTRTDSIAGFYDDSLVFDPSAKTSTSTLYKAYQDYCKESGLSAKSIHKFTPDLVELCSIKLGLAVSGYRSSKGRSIVGLRFRSDSDAYVAYDASKTKASSPSNSLPELGVSLMTLSESNHSQKIQNPEQEKNLVSPLGEEKTKIQTPVDKKEELPTSNSQSVTSDTLGSETEFKSVTPSVINQHQTSQASLERGTSIVLSQGTKVRSPHTTQGCTTLHKFKVGDLVKNEQVGRTGTIVEIRVKSTPKGTEYVQFRVDFGFDSCWFEDVVLQPHKTAV
jgi:P4 family phage/plasmid primase-like protien